MAATEESTYSPERSRVELRVDGELAAWVDLRPAGASTILAHTEVAGGHERQGLGRKAVRAALRHIDDDGKDVIVVCPFALALMRNEPELAAS